MPAPSPVVTCSGLSFAWPDGTAVFTDLSLVISPGRTGLIGVNGSGKSTLLRLIAGELKPAAGSVTVAGELGYVPQNLALGAPDTRVEEALGIAGIRAAVAAIEAGDASEENFARVGEDWDVEERARATLDRLGLEQVPLDRRIGELSGGEGVLVCLAAEFLRRPGVLLLDEPTNNLDLAARQRLYEAVGSWKGAMVIVSHDRELLELVDQIGELRSGQVRWYGGNLSDYERAVAVEQEAAERDVRAAEEDGRQQRELIEARIKLDRRLRYGQKMQETGGIPKIVAGNLKRQAEVSAGKLRTGHEDRLGEARERLAAAEDAVRDDDEIRIDLPATAVPSGRGVLALSGVEVRYGARADLLVRGPERMALTGRNGAGKTTLLRTIAGLIPAVAGEVKVTVPARYLPQRLDILDPGLTIVENVARAAPAATQNQIRSQLARFLFRGRRADQRAGTLSGGELFRATLASLVLAEPAPQLLMLDEPTNNLDMASVRQLSGALRSYRGALLVASHDAPFLRELGLTRWLRLDGDLAEIDPL